MGREESYAVIDFETTGLSPGWGDRATEVAIVLVKDGLVVDRYQSLMRTGMRIPAFVEELTGITNEMVEAAPSASRVMRDAAAFVGAVPLIAHNASFDSKFWEVELERVGITRQFSFACSMRVARRIYQDAPNHRLDTLVDHVGLRFRGRHHRAMADAEMTVRLVERMGEDINNKYKIGKVTHAILREIQVCPKRKIAQRMEEIREEARAA